MAKTNLNYYCKPITIKDEKTIMVMPSSFSYQLFPAEITFVKNAGNNAMAFIKETFGSQLLLLCNKESGEVLIPDIYSELERVKILQGFIKYLFSVESVSEGTPMLFDENER